MSINKAATLAEIELVLKISKRSVERRAAKENWVFSEVGMSGKNKRREYALKDLPKDLQNLLMTHRFSESLTAQHVVPVTAAKPQAVVPVQAVALTDMTEDQRDKDRARETLFRFVDGFTGSKEKALAFLNDGYANNELSSPLVWAIEHAFEKPRDCHLSLNTFNKWLAVKKQRGSAAPLKRQKDMSVKNWMPLAVELKKGPQGKTIAMIHELLEEAHGDGAPSYDVLCSFFREFSQGDLLKGRWTGMQLRGRQHYQQRTSDGLMPWDEVHADGWNTHFTAPHPVNGDFVTYELWDFHDVATRYVPPFGIGLSECFEVIAKGLENCIRDGGVMAILQTDSTKIIKNNAKFSGDPVRSIGDRAGITIVHPQEVGNAQANGISENFHTWLDKQSRALATYQNKDMDSLTLRRVKKLTADMVKAAKSRDFELSDKLKKQAEKAGQGRVFSSYQEAVDWLESIRQKWNNHPHSSLKKVRDTATGRMRHQSPQEALDEFRAAGWEPVKMEEAHLQDLFRPHVQVNVKRGVVTPYGGMRFRHTELDHYEGKAVIVAYDIMDWQHVWVKDLRGDLICVAKFCEATGYRTVSAYEAAQEKRAAARIRGLKKKEETIREKAGIVDHNIIDVMPSTAGLVRINPQIEERPQPLQAIDGLFEKDDKANGSYADTVMFLWGNQETEPPKDEAVSQ